MSNYIKSTDFSSKDALLPGDPNKIVKGGEINDEFDGIQTAINSKANTLSPTLAGTPTAPTAAVGTNSTQVATTAFVTTAVTNGVDASKVDTVLTGTPTAPTAAVGTDSTQIATTAFVNAEIANDITAPLALKAPLANPTFTGTPTAPTASPGTNTTQVATTAFVKTALEAVYPVGSIYISTIAINPATTFGFGTWTVFGAGKVLVGQDTGDTSFDVLEETGGSKDAIVVNHTHNITDPGHSHAPASGSTFVTTNFSGDGAFDSSQISGPIERNPFSSNTATATTDISISATGSPATNANLQPYVVVKMWKRVT